VGDVELYQFGDRDIRVIAPPGVFDFPVSAKRPFVFDGDPAVKGLESHLYVIEFGEHGIKVGYTADPMTRMIAHQRDGRHFSRHATCGWLSMAHVEAKDNEEALIGFCAELTGIRVERRSEYSAAPFGRVQEYAAALPMTRGDRQASEERSRRLVADFASMMFGGSL
jgi:hypothetical protein